MKWWAPKPERVIICYACRKRVSEAELAAGLHDHFDHRDDDSDAPPRPDVGLGGD